MSWYRILITLQEILNEKITGSASNDDWAQRDLGLEDVLTAMQIFSDQEKAGMYSEDDMRGIIANVLIKAASVIQGRNGNDTKEKALIKDKYAIMQIDINQFLNPK